MRDIKHIQFNNNKQCCTVHVVPTYWETKFTLNEIRELGKVHTDHDQCKWVITEIRSNASKVIYGLSNENPSDLMMCLNELNPDYLDFDDWLTN